MTVYSLVGMVEIRTIEPDAAAAATGFVAVRELGSVTLAPSGKAIIALPADTFQHATQSGGFQLSATQSDGAPLPGWMTFDSATGLISMTPPAGLQGTVDVTITARDRQGHVASTQLSLTVQ
jgi:hypothetical protein